MIEYLIRRLLFLIPVLLIVSIVAYMVIELPPGDYLTTHIMRLRAAGTHVAEDEIARLTRMFGLDKPPHIRYFLWIWKIVRYGDLGLSFQWNKPVTEVIGERLALTMTISIITLLFSWTIGILIGIYSATHQYSIFDYSFTFLGFIGVSIPSYLLALVIMYFVYSRFGLAVTGLFSPAYADAPWSIHKVLDLLSHIWLPVVIIGTGGTAGIARIMRGTLLDELRKQYVITARAKGLPERRLIFKYPVRIAINPLISSISWLLPSIISGETITSIVLNLPTCGPVLFRALMTQDEYLAGSFILILSSLAIIGALIADLVLAWIDPRIRYEKMEG
ncbi:ABC transporter permease [bacterium]|nr:ABC transporter permease [bacterium]